MTAADVGSLADLYPNTYSTRSQLRTVLGHYWKMIDVEGPGAAVLAPKPPPPRYRGLDRDEASRMVKAARGWYPDGLAVLTGLYLGLRRSEIAGLAWLDFDAGLEEVEILGKGRKLRYLPVHDALRTELELCRGSGYVFPGTAGRSSVHTGTVALWVKRVARAAGTREIGAHGLRHTCLNQLYEDTSDIALVQEFAGHASVTTTTRYTMRQRKDRLKLAVCSSLQYDADEAAA